jgi:Tfp pilus assembly protein PilV
MKKLLIKLSLSCLSLVAIQSLSFAQSAATKINFKKNSICAGIEVGSKGVKMSVIDVKKGTKERGAFSILKDTTFNTDFISFTEASFQNTLNGFTGFFQTAMQYGISSNRIFTVISSGVKGQSEKENKTAIVTRLIDSFRLRIGEPTRKVEIVNADDEARLSHLGIVPDDERYVTFLIDIGSGNTKGGYFPNGNVNNFKLFQINWGTKSTTNNTLKRCGKDLSMANFSKQLKRVATEAENGEIIFAVNNSSGFAASDNIALSGGISWAVSVLLHPEKIKDPVVPVTYAEVTKFSEDLVNNFKYYNDTALVQRAKLGVPETEELRKTAKTVLKVFDQQSMLAGTTLLLKLMRQFESLFDKKQFYLVKNGQVGWVSAYVDAEKSK